MKSTIFDSITYLVEKTCRKCFICTICQESVYRGSIVYNTKCNHKFHKHCLLLYIISEEIRCPLCRKNIQGDL
jgi:hypothetical protein